MRSCWEIGVTTKQADLIAINFPTPNNLGNLLSLISLYQQLLHLVLQILAEAEPALKISTRCLQFYADASKCNDTIAQECP